MKNINDTDTSPTLVQHSSMPNGYKKTAVGIIPNNWDVKKLGEIAKVKHGRDQKKVESINGIYPILGTGGIIGKTNEYLYDKPSVLIGRKGTIDKPRFMDTPFWTVDTLFYTEITSEINPLWLFNFFKTIDWYYYNQATGVPSLSASVISAIKLPIPPLPEQQKIAEILSTWDKAISLTKNSIETLKARNKGLAQQLLTGKKKVSGFSEKWETINLGKIATRITTKNEELDDTVVTISAQRGFVLQEDFFNKRVASDTLSGYYLIKKGQFAYNKSYSNGYPMGAFKRLNDFEKAVVTTLYICFEFKENVCSDYMVHFFENGFMINNLMKVAKEGGRAHGLLNIGLEDFMNLELTIPSYKEQTAISQILETADQELKSYRAKLEALQNQKKGLMQQLLTGKIRVNVN